MGMFFVCGFFPPLFSSILAYIMFLFFYFEFFRGSGLACFKDFYFPLSMILLIVVEYFMLFLLFIMLLIHTVYLDTKVEVF